MKYDFSDNLKRELAGLKRRAAMDALYNALVAIYRFLYFACCAAFAAYVAAGLFE